MIAPTVVSDAVTHEQLDAFFAEHIGGCLYGGVVPLQRAAYN